MNAKQRRRIDRTAGKDQEFNSWLKKRPNLLTRVSEVGARRRYVRQMVEKGE